MEAIAQKLNRDQLIYLQQEIFPKLDGSVSKLIDYLIKTNEPQRYIKQKRIQLYQQLYIQQEDLRNKGQFELGSDYNEESDEEYKNAELALEEFESINMQHMNELEEIKDTKFVTHTLKQLEKERVLSGSPTKNQKAQQASEMKFQQLIKLQEQNESDSSNLSEEEDSYYSSPNQQRRKKTVHEKPFNPLEFIANELKRQREWERLKEEEQRIQRQYELEQQEKQQHDIEIFQENEQQIQNNNNNEEESPFKMEKNLSNIQSQSEQSFHSNILQNSQVSSFHQTETKENKEKQQNIES